ncbi:MAG: hypothetical protein KGL93_07930 [Gemmatimonadota bacterium]|nr:hypothetical protein [Gemmatimonadota bacterium]
MKTLIKINQMLLRLFVLVLLVLGVMLWMGRTTLMPAHIGLGFLFALLVLIQGVLGGVARAGWGLAALAIVWAICLPAIGFGQLSWMPGNAHWIVRVVHLVFGLGVMPVVERIGKRALTQTPAA